MRKAKQELDYSMDFELAMRQFFGDDAYQLAGAAHDEKYVKKWLLKAVRKMQKDVMKLDTTTRHRERLLGDLERLEKYMKASNNEWDIIFRMFFLCSRFLGYDFAQGAIYNSPIYHQSPSQYHWSKRNVSKDYDTLDEHLKDEKNTIKKQKEIIKSLKDEGYDDFHIALILGMSEYQVKKLKKEI